MAPRTIAATIAQKMALRKGRLLSSADPRTRAHPAEGAKAVDAHTAAKVAPRNSVTAGNTDTITKDLKKTHLETGLLQLLNSNTTASP